MGTKRYTDADFVRAVRDSVSIRQVLHQLGLVGAGGNYHQAKLRIKNLDIDTSHFLGQAHLQGKSHCWAKKIPLNEILVEDCRYNGSVRNRLLREGIFENKCYECGLVEWKGKPMSFELEHKNGNRFDNRLENLTFLCPNCHSQTRYFRGRNKKKHEKKTLYFCSKCNKHLSAKRKTNLCLKCYLETNGIHKQKQKKDSDWRTRPKPHTRKVVRPDKEELRNMIDNMTWTAIGKRFGVSDNAIRKWAKSYGIQ